MATTEWTDARLDDAFENLRSEIRDMRAEMRAGFADVHAEVRAGFADVHADIRQIWVTMIAGYVTIVAALIATQL